MDYLTGIFFGGAMSVGIVTGMTAVSFLVASIILHIYPGLSAHVRRIFHWKEYIPTPVMRRQMILGDPFKKAKIKSIQPATWKQSPSAFERIVSDKNDQAVLDLQCSISPVEEDSNDDLLDFSDIDISNEIAASFISGIAREQRILAAKNRFARRQIHPSGKYKILRDYFPCCLCKKPRRVYDVLGVCSNCTRNPLVVAYLRREDDDHKINN